MATPNSPPKSRPRSGPTPAIHPYLDWAIQTQFVYLRQGNWLPLLVEFDAAALPRVRGKTPLEVFTGLGWLPSTFNKDVVVPEPFRNPPKLIRKARKFRYCVLLIQRKAAATLTADSSWQATIVRAELGPPMLSSNGPPTLPVKAIAQAAPSVLGPRVLMCVIDEGIAFANAQFGTTAAAGTRIEFLWSQDSGIELDAPKIKVLLGAATAAEELAYRAAGLLSFAADGYKPLARRRSHGTFVLDLLAGEDPTSARPDRPIIAVEMPEEAVGDPAGSTLQVHAAWGLTHILSRVDAIRAVGEKLPVIVNLSYGPHDGPHDGTALFESVADFFTNLYSNSDTPLKVVLAAGNFRQSRTHASFTQRPGSKTLDWRLQPGGLTPSFMEIWFPAAASAGISVTLRSPLGQQITVSSTNSPAWFPNQISPVMGAQFVPANPGSSRMGVLLTIARTALDPRVAGNQPVASSGVWTVVVRNGTSRRVAFDVWIRRTDTPGGRRAKGRQSYLDDPRYQRFRATAPVATRPVEFDLLGSADCTRQGTLSGIATGETTVVIGGYRRGSQWNPSMHPASYSSEGPHANPKRTLKSPTCLFPSDDSLACRGVLAAGNQSGSRVAVNGTSVAAPLAARWIANQWIVTGVEPKPPFAGLVPPIPDPLNPIPPVDLPLTVGDGLMPIPVSNPRRV